MLHITCIYYINYIYIYNIYYIYILYKFHFKVEILHKNSYPTKFVDKCIGKFVNNIFVQKSAVITVPKLELRIALQY